VRIHYQEAGDEDAPPLILIHGFISSNLVWNEVFLPLAGAGFRVIAPDLPAMVIPTSPSTASTPSRPRREPYWVDGSTGD